MCVCGGGAAGCCITSGFIKHWKMTSRTSKQQWVGRTRVWCHLLQFSLLHLQKKTEERKEKRYFSLTTKWACIDGCMFWYLRPNHLKSRGALVTHSSASVQHDGWSLKTSCAQTEYRRVGNTSHGYGTFARLPQWRHGSLGPGLLYST